MGEKFALDNTLLPKTLENEIVVYFNHKDCSQGGFTIGKHMHGISDPTGRFPATPSNAGLANWRGNLWRGAPAPNASYNTDVVYNTTNKTITVTLYAPYDDCPHHDVLGYMGFPAENGVIHLSDPYNDASLTGNWGNMFAYTHRTRNDKTGTHVFHGVTGDTYISRHKIHTHSNTAPTLTLGDFVVGEETDSISALITPVANWTTLVTDELMAAVTMPGAINLTDPNEETTFDCTNMYLS